MKRVQLGPALDAAQVPRRSPDELQLRPGWG
jgi:hypothetical protein